MDLQDTLRTCNFDTQVAIAKIRENIKLIQAQPSNTKKAIFPKKKAVKRHETNEASESESDEEGEYADKRVVVSDDSDEYESGDEEYKRFRGVADEDTFDDRPMSDDQRRVFDFFNEGTTQELACVQGCSKKKVVNIFELRPFESWRDLVSKVQTFPITLSSLAWQLLQDCSSAATNTTTM